GEIQSKLYPTAAAKQFTRRSWSFWNKKKTLKIRLNYFELGLGYDIGPPEGLLFPTKRTLIMQHMAKIVNSHTVKFEFPLSGGRELIWQYLTKPELIGKWMMPCTMQPELGGLVSLCADPMPESVVDSNIQEAHPSV